MNRTTVVPGDKDTPGFFSVVYGPRPYLVAEGNLPAISDPKRLAKLRDALTKALREARNFKDDAGRRPTA